MEKAIKQADQSQYQLNCIANITETIIIKNSSATANENDAVESPL